MQPLEPLELRLVEPNKILGDVRLGSVVVGVVPVVELALIFRINWVCLVILPKIKAKRIHQLLQLQSVGRNRRSIGYVAVRELGPVFLELIKNLQPLAILHDLNLWPRGILTHGLVLENKIWLLLLFWGHR